MINGTNGPFLANKGGSSSHRGANQLKCRPRAVTMNHTGGVRVRLIRSHSQSPIKDIITKTKTKTNWNPSSSC